MTSSSEESVREFRKRKKSTRDTFLEELRRLEDKYKQSYSRDRRPGTRRERSRSRSRGRSRSPLRERSWLGRKNDERIAGKNRRTSHSSREYSSSPSRHHIGRSRRAEYDKENDERIAGINRRTSHFSRKGSQPRSRADKESGERYLRDASRSSRKKSNSPKRAKVQSTNRADRGSGERYLRDASRSSRSRSCSRNRESTPSSHASDGEKSEESVKQRDIEDKEGPTELNESTLGLLGDDPSKEDQTGPDIHVAVAERWEKILRDGLSKELRSELQAKYPTIGNCRLTKAPKLNLEIKAAVSAIGLKKDTYQHAAQNQLGAGINAIGAALTELLNAEKSTEQTVDTSKFIERLADAGRILADLHHSMSKTRKSFIVPGLNPIIKLIADDSSVDAWLFGENFSERLKAAQTMEKSSKTLAKKTGGYRKNTDGRDENRRFQSSRPRQGGYSNQQYSGRSNWRRPSGSSHRGTQRKGQKPRDLRSKDNQPSKD